MDKKNYLIAGIIIFVISYIVGFVANILPPLPPIRMFGMLMSLVSMVGKLVGVILFIVGLVKAATPSKFTEEENKSI